MNGLKSISRLNYETNSKDSKNMKIIMKEITKELPLHLDLSSHASMFVRYDEEYPQFIRACLTGIEGTPYESGIFMFDIYCGNDYPNTNCDIIHITPGESEISSPHTPGGFSPNLHRSTGKVCLSLLGTWSGPGWTPNESNVYQVLSSILWMIFGAEMPYYMEPSHGGWEGFAPKKEDDHEDDVYEYQRNIQIGTLKYAINEYLKNPPNGFEKVVITHFLLKRNLINLTIKNWIKKSDNENFKNELTTLLNEFNSLIEIELNK